MSKDEMSIIPKGTPEQFAMVLESMEGEYLDEGLGVINQIRDLIIAEKGKRELAWKTQATEAWNEHCRELIDKVEHYVDTHYQNLVCCAEYSPTRGSDYERANEYTNETMATDENDEQVFISSHCEKSYFNTLAAIDELNQFPKEGHKRYNLHLNGYPEMGKESFDYGHHRNGDDRIVRCIACNEDATVLSYIDRGGQEMPGAPVYPDVEYWQCRACGFETKGKVEYTTDGVDLAGQSLYASMTTREVAEMCVCRDPEYGPENCINPECLREMHTY